MNNLKDNLSSNNIFDMLQSEPEFLKGLRCFEFQCTNRKVSSEESYEILKNIIAEYFAKNIGKTYENSCRESEDGFGEALQNGHDTLLK